jgi:hypothetical protein
MATSQIVPARVVVIRRCFIAAGRCCAAVGDGWRHVVCALQGEWS